MSALTFDPSKTQDENIGIFLDFIDNIDQELAKLIKEKLDLLLLLPKAGSSEKTRMRKLLCQEVLRIIENESRGAQ